MIKSAVVAMTLLGCDCDAEICEFITETPPQWTSVAECETAMRSRIVRQSDMNYPLISGECRLVITPEIAPATVMTATVSAPFAEADDDDMFASVASGARFIFRKSGDSYALVSSGIRSAAGNAADLMTRSAELIAWK